MKSIAPPSPSENQARTLPRREFLHYLGAGALGLALSGIRAKAAQDSGATAAPAAAPRSGPKPMRGLFPIGQTPFLDNDKIDLDSLGAEVKFCNRGGVHGFIWPQIASGWSVLSEKERLDGAEAILASGKGGNTALVIGVQDQAANMASVARYARHAAAHGADALVSLPPANVTDEKVLLDYYQQVGRLTDLPLFVQSQGTMSIDLMVEIVKTIPTVRQAKDEAGNPLERITELRRRTNDQLNVFSGNGVRTMINEMELGFMGHCPTTGLADVYAATFDLWHAGKRQEAFDMFGRICAFSSMGTTGMNSVLAARGVFPPTVKTRKAPPTPGVDVTPTGGGRGGAAGLRAGPPLDDQAIREALNAYLKPYLRA
jgi:dihydrodipicolinate synthase/N-acetylneuraminate lyase